MEGISEKCRVQNESRGSTVPQSAICFVRRKEFHHGGTEAWRRIRHPRIFPRRRDEEIRLFGHEKAQKPQKRKELSHCFSGTGVPFQPFSLLCLLCLFAANPNCICCCVSLPRSSPIRIASVAAFLCRGLQNGPAPPCFRASVVSSSFRVAGTSRAVHSALCTYSHFSLTLCTLHLFLHNSPMDPVFICVQFFYWLFSLSTWFGGVLFHHGGGARSCFRTIRESDPDAADCAERQSRRAAWNAAGRIDRYRQFARGDAADPTCLRDHALAATFIAQWIVLVHVQLPLLLIRTGLYVAALVLPDLRLAGDFTADFQASPWSISITRMSRRWTNPAQGPIRPVSPPQSITVLMGFALPRFVGIGAVSKAPGISTAQTFTFSLTR